MSDFNGYFKDWNITAYQATHKDGRSLWIANGFMMLADQSHYKASLKGYGLIDRYRLWKELKRQIRLNSATPTTPENKSISKED